MATFWIILGAIVGGGLGWLLDRRFRKHDKEEDSCQVNASHG